MEEKHQVMDKAPRKPWPAGKRCVDGICRATALLGSCWEEPWVHPGFGTELLAG